MNGTKRFKLGAGAGLVTMLLGALMVLAPGAGAHGGDSETDPNHNNDPALWDVTFGGATLEDGDTVFKYTVSRDGGGDPLSHVEVANFCVAPKSVSPGFDEDSKWNNTPSGQVYLITFDGDYTDKVDLTDGSTWYLKKGSETLTPDHDVVNGTKTFKSAGPDCSTQPTYSVTIDKTNDANGDGTFGDPEQSPTAGASVPFKLVITNTGTGALTIESLTDTWPGQVGGALDLLAANALACGGGEDLNANDSLAAGDSVTCTFTVTNYAPGAGGSLTNTVALGTLEAADVSDTSVVTTPAAQPTYDVTITKANNANGTLPYSGDETTTTGAAVPFEIVITNTGTGPVTLVSLVDTWPTDNSLNLLGEDVLACGEGEDAPDLRVGDVLAAGDSVTCYFTVAGYGPAAGTSVTNTVTLNTNQTGPDTATSIVRGPTPSEIPTFTYAIDVDKQNNADEDDDFSSFENAAAEGDDVEFEITIESLGTGAVTLATLTDTFDGEVMDLLTDVDLSCLRGVTTVELAVGSVLPANSTTVCRFTLEDYAPAPGGSLTNVVAVDTLQTEAVTDDSTVAVAAVLPEATGTVTLVKEVTGDTIADWSFDFTGALGTVTLTDEAAETPATPVEAGSYSIAEDITDLGTGWEFSDATCVDQSDAVVGEADADGSVDFMVAANADITCTFVNEYTAPEPAVAPEVEVKGDVVTRTLPRTGNESKGLAGAGVLLVALGAAMVLGSKRQLAQR